jgi:hypothetical protein
MTKMSRKTVRSAPASHEALARIYFESSEGARMEAE